MQTQIIELETVYTAAMEREAVKSQQRPAPVPVREHVGRVITDRHRTRVGEFLVKFPQAWTVEEVSLLTNLTDYQMTYANRGRRGHPQRYQWVTARNGAAA